MQANHHGFYLLCQTQSAGSGHLSSAGFAGRWRLIIQWLPGESRFPVCPVVSRPLVPRRSLYYMECPGVPGHRGGVLSTEVDVFSMQQHQGTRLTLYWHSLQNTHAGNYHHQQMCPVFKLLLRRLHMLRLRWLQLQVEVENQAPLLAAAIDAITLK